MDDELAVLNQSVLTEEFILPLPEHSDSAVQGELLTLQQTFLIPHTSISSDQEDAHNENFDSDDEKFAIYHGEQATDDYAEGKEEADDDTDADIAIEVEEDSEVLDEAAGSHQQQPRCRTCKKGECLEALGEHVVHKNRQRWKRLNRSQKRLAAQALLSSSIHRHAADHKRRNRSSKPASAVQARLRVDYNFLGVRLCRDAFSYVTTMGERGIKNILADLREDVSIPNPSRQGKNVKGIQHPRTKAVVAFVLEVAYKEGWQNPGNRGPVIFLPLTHTKKEMYGRYKSIPNPSHELGKGDMFMLQRFVLYELPARSSMCIIQTTIHTESYIRHTVSMYIADSSSHMGQTKVTIRILFQQNTSPALLIFERQ
eukprot:m.219681 g.219681  ORF g.219681 m.219681 type:complete len:370 (-) comp17003_c5_seq4:1312-2421(-)